LGRPVIYIDDLAREVSEQQQRPFHAVRSVLVGLRDAIIAHVGNRQAVQVQKLGTFTYTHCRARRGRNPATGKLHTIPATTRPRFVPGGALREALLEGR